jgi:pyrimidine-nucleoside phosphorylase
MAAWCATAGLRGVPYEASLAVVRALLGSGDRLELGRFGATVDIRTTGGVGDSALVVAASCIAAAAGVIVASTGARSIAHVGGVLDAVAAVPGMRPAMSVEEYVVQARDAGMVIAEPGDRLVPDERRLARLRDATATADGDVVVGVAAAARAISGGAGVIAVDVAAGPGGLLPDLDHARAAADLTARLGAEWARTVVSSPVLRAEPLGGVAGHALEMKAAFDVLRGHGDAALGAEAVRLAASALAATGRDGGEATCHALLADGRAAAAAERWIAAQGGDPAVVGHPDLLPQSRLRTPVIATGAGEVGRVDAGVVGAAARWLGAGRLDPGQVIDPAVGVEVIARPGAVVSEGDVLFIVHASDEWLAGRAVDMLLTAVSVAR